LLGSFEGKFEPLNVAVALNPCHHYIQ